MSAEAVQPSRPAPMQGEERFQDAASRSSAGVSSTSLPEAAGVPSIGTDVRIDMGKMQSMNDSSGHHVPVATPSGLRALEEEARHSSSKRSVNTPV